jgi:hypothetical protein
MPTVHEQLSEQFYCWERRGRGGQLFDGPVYPEPPFVPFPGHCLPDTPAVDTGRRETAISSLWRKIAAPPPKPVAPAEPEEEPQPPTLIRDPLTELQVILPAELDAGSLDQFFQSLSFCKEPIAFELLGAQKKITVQFAAAQNDAPLLRRQLSAHFREIQIKTTQDALAQTWTTCSGKEELVAELGLAREFMFTMAAEKSDPFVSLIGALSELGEAELGLFQVLWQPLREAWPENILRSVTDGEGKPFFVNVPELTKAAETKVSKPLFAAVVRIAAKAGTFDRALQIAADMAGSLRAYANPQGNQLIPLSNEVETYPLDDHIADMLFRQSRRSGMILNSDELAGFVHLPSDDVQSPALTRDAGQTKAAPDVVRNKTGSLLGHNVHLDESVPVVLTPEQRVHHTHIIGTTGTGKSTLLFNLIRQDIENGEGVAVLDPHGDLINNLLGIIPPERVGDVVLVDLEDEDFSVGFNILHAHGNAEHKLLASDLVSLFRRLSTSWGDQMDAVLHNAIIAFLNSSRGGTLADLRRFLVEEKFRKDFLTTVSDPNTLYYWQKGFQTLGGNRSIGSVITRLNDFLAEPPIYNMVAQQANRLDFADIMDGGKIFLAKLPEGIVGRENSYLLGAVLVSKFQQLVMARQAQKMEARRNFWIYIDEFANFITPSMAEILSGARKYRIGLTLAHHELHQLQRVPEVASAVMAHPHTRIVFRVSDDDAKKLADGFSSFKADRLKNLGKGQAICRVERSEFDFNLSVELPELPGKEWMEQQRRDVVTVSRNNYGTPRATVEAALRQAMEMEPQPQMSKPKPPPDEPPTASISPVSEPLKVSEVPKATGSEKKIAGPEIEEESQHNAIKELIRAQAEPLDYSVSFEELVASSQGRADVVLRRGNRSIACEITVTTPVEYEVGNLTKCLNGNFGHIAAISRNRKKLEHIQQLLAPAATPEQMARVGFYSPEEFVSKLHDWAMDDPGGGILEKGKPRKRKIVFDTSQLTEAERKQREEDMLKALTEAMKRK